MPEAMKQENVIQKWPRIKQNLTPEMMFAIRLQTAMLLFLMTVLVVAGFQLGWGWYGVILAAVVGWVNGTYWAVYIKRGIDRRFQAAEEKRVFEERKAREDPFPDVPDRLLNNQTQRLTAPPLQQNVLPGSIDGDYR
jgi:hypothetical protein